MPTASNHPFQKTLTQPDPDAIVWRFMPITAFLALIQTGQLAFGRADKMNDLWEGAYSDPALERDHLEPGEEITPPMTFGGIHHELRQLVNLNCWYVSDTESFGMWEVYKHGGQGVGIRTTWKKLTQSIDPYGKCTIFAGRVEYVDYLKSRTRGRHLTSPFFYKRPPFKSEQEARLVVGAAKFSETHDSSQNGTYNEVLELAPVPLKVDVDLRNLVDEVIVAPDSGAWVLNAIQRCITLEDLRWEVRPSSLDAELWRV